MSEQNGSTLDDTMKSESNKSRTERATKAKATYEKSKKTAKKLKSIKALGPLISVISTFGIILLILFLIIGFIGFFVTLPGLAMDKIKKACEGFFKWCFGDQSIKVESADINSLAQYINDLGYDLVGYGFASSNSIDADGKINLDNNIEPVEIAEVSDLLSNNIKLNMKSDTVINISTDSKNSSTDSKNSSTVIFPSDVMSDANIISVSKRSRRSSIL